VENRNINRNLAMGKETVQAILDGAQQIAVPAFVSTLCICIVFIPMFFLGGGALFVRAAGRSSFLRHARVLHVVANDRADHGDVPALPRKTNTAPKNTRRKARFFRRYQQGFEHLFERFREGYRHALSTALESSALFSACFSDSACFPRD